MFAQIDNGQARRQVRQVIVAPEVAALIVACRAAGGSFSAITGRWHLTPAEVRALLGTHSVPEVAEPVRAAGPLAVLLAGAAPCCSAPPPEPSAARTRCGNGPPRGWCVMDRHAVIPRAYPWTPCGATHRPHGSPGSAQSKMRPVGGRVVVVPPSCLAGGAETCGRDGLSWSLEGGAAPGRGDAAPSVPVGVAAVSGDLVGRGARVLTNLRASCPAGPPFAHGCWGRPRTLPIRGVDARMRDLRTKGRQRE
jgi:hypothetical protein